MCPTNKTLENTEAEAELTTEAQPAASQREMDEYQNILF